MLHLYSLRSLDNNFFIRKILIEQISFNMFEQRKEVHLVKFIIVTSDHQRNICNGRKINLYRTARRDVTSLRCYYHNLFPITHLHYVFIHFLSVSRLAIFDSYHRTRFTYATFIFYLRCISLTHRNGKAFEAFVPGWSRLYSKLVKSTIP